MTLTSIERLRELARRADSNLRGNRIHAAGKLSLPQMILLVTTFTALYGAVMGTSAGFRDGHSLQILYSALKVPLLLGATFSLSVPSYFVLYSLAGLRSSFFTAISAVLAAQTAVALTLASLSSFTALWYLSFTDYTGRVLFNGLMFAIATIAGQFLIRQFYKPLIAQTPKHRTLLRIWIYVYFFVGIQMAWLLRPFVGEPSLETHFIRQQMWGNAYLIVGRMIWRFLFHG